MSANHIGDHVAPYAFGALSMLDRQRVEKHVEECDQCGELLREAESIATLLPYAATPYKAPADLKEALFGHLDAENLARQEENGVAHAETSAARAEQRALQPPDWARPDAKPWWWSLVWRTIPWTAAAAGWIVAVVLLLYSHGQADRLSTTQQDLQGQVTSLQAQTSNLTSVQSFLNTPGITVVPLRVRNGAVGASVSLFMAPRYAHGLVVARGLSILSSDRIYQIWVKGATGIYEPVGTLTTSGSRADGATLILGLHPLDRYKFMGLSVEPAPGSTKPTSPMIFTTVL